MVNGEFTVYHLAKRILPLTIQKNHPMVFYHWVIFLFHRLPSSIGRFFLIFGYCTELLPN